MTRKEGITVEVNGQVGVVITIEILFSKSPVFHDFDVVWTADVEPDAIEVTEAMKNGNGLLLFGGGLLSWDYNEVIAMVVRLKCHEKNKENSRPYFHDEQTE